MSIWGSTWIYEGLFEFRAPWSTWKKLIDGPKVTYQQIMDKLIDG